VGKVGKTWHGMPAGGNNGMMLRKRGCDVTREIEWPRRNGFRPTDWVMHSQNHAIWGTLTAKNGCGGPKPWCALELLRLRLYQIH